MMSEERNEHQERWLQWRATIEERIKELEKKFDIVKSIEEAFTRQHDANESLENKINELEYSIQEEAKFTKHRRENLESVLKEFLDSLWGLAINKLPISKETFIDDLVSFTERLNKGAGGNPKEKVHDMSFQDIDLDKEPTTDFPEAPYEGAPLWERYYYEGWKTRDMELQEELKDAPAEDITIEEVVTTANKTFKTIEKELIAEFVKDLNEAEQELKSFIRLDHTYAFYGAKDVAFIYDKVKEKWQKK